MCRIFEVAKAVIIGHSVADALGVPVEFQPRECFDEKPVTGMMGYGTHHEPVGTWSDDTSMTLATLDSLKNGIDYEDIMKKFVLWLDYAEYTATGRVFDAGVACVDSILAYKRGLSAIECGRTGEFENGNGSLMRIHPMVLYLYDKDMPIDSKLRIIHELSSLTHAHQRSVMACGIYAFVLWELIKSPTKQSVTVGLKKAFEYYSGEEELTVFNRVFSPEFYSADRSVVKSSGYVVDTLEAALWCLINTSTYKDCVLAAVNLGLDTDTVAAVSGGLAGALYGYENIPKEWREQLASIDYIERLIEEVFENDRY